MPLPNRKPGHKFNAKRTEANGRSYASKLEAEYATYLKWLQKTGQVVGWLEQVPFHLPGKKKYVIDFLVFYGDGSCKFIEIKGMETAVWKLKIAQARELYPWAEFEIIKRKDFRWKGDA